MNCKMFSLDGILLKMRSNGPSTLGTQYWLWWLSGARLVHEFCMSEPSVATWSQLSSGNKAYLLVRYTLASAQVSGCSTIPTWAYIEYCGGTRPQSNICRSFRWKLWTSSSERWVTVGSESAVGTQFRKSEFWKSHSPDEWSYCVL